MNFSLNRSHQFDPSGATWMLSCSGLYLACSRGKKQGRCSSSGRTEKQFAKTQQTQTWLALQEPLAKLLSKSSKPAINLI